MRRLLDTLFRLCAVLAALFLLAILLLILAQTIGRQVGVVVPSTNEMAGLCMAATTFLALAPTLRAGGHIRVTLVISRLGPRVRMWTEIWCQLFALFIVGYFAWYAADLALASYERGRVTPGLIALPLWPPQAGVAFGLVMLAVALVEALAEVLWGRTPSYERHAAPMAAPPDETD
jgi:TRAP-type C4-dicarboxylate transport system permease small subunit